MKHQILLWVFLMTTLLSNSCTNMPEQNTKQMGKIKGQESVVVFACEHGSAKSVVAAAHFNQLARQRNLDVWAISRGTDPDQEIPTKVIQGLRTEGLVAGEAKPQLLSQADVAGAIRVVAFCPLPEDYKKLAPIEEWKDVPPISEDYNKSRDAMVVHINRLLDEIKAGK